VKRRWSRRFLTYPGVVGVGVDPDSRGGFHLTVFLTTPDAGKGLPHIVDGHRVHFRVAGTLEEHTAATM